MTSNNEAGDLGGSHDLNDPQVVIKYKDAANIVTKAMKAVMLAAQVGANTFDLCQLGDDTMMQLISKIYERPVKGEKIMKGIAFPTCVSRNAICGYYSPLDEKSGEILEEGDLIKINMGAHIDGYISVLAHSLIVGNDEPTKGPAADVILAARNAGDIVIRMIENGTPSQKVVEAVNRIISAYGCNPIVGTYSHNMKRHVLAGNKRLFLRESPENKNKEFIFQVGEVYSIDIMVSTGEGKPKETEYSPTIYRRLVENTYTLGTKSARAFMAEVNNRFPTLPFSIRSMKDQRGIRLSTAAACQHSLLVPYPVQAERRGELVAQVRYTVLMLPNGPRQINGIDIASDILESERKITDPDLLEILAKPIPGRKPRVLQTSGVSQ